jgi:hypothetical protein
MHEQDSTQPAQQGAAPEPRPLDAGADEPQRPITRPLNADLHEQSAPFSRPARNTDPREQPQPVLAARRPRIWPWVLAALVLAGALAGVVAVASTAFYTTVSETQTFTLSGVPTLVMNVPSGNVHIESGLPGQVSVVASKDVFLGQSNLLPIHYVQSGSTLTITADAQNTLARFSKNSVDFDLFVPSQSNLGISIGSGSIQANGIIGTIQLHTSSGFMQADNLAGALTLKTDSGSIIGSNLKGQMTLSASSGSLTVKEVSATNNSSFQTETGSIDFQGMLVPEGTFLFRAATGSIDVTLSKDASFHMDASTQNGSIASAFSAVKVQPGASGMEAHGDVGSPPRSTVILQTNNGSILLHQQ